MWYQYDKHWQTPLRVAGLSTLSLKLIRLHMNDIEIASRLDGRSRS